MSSRSNRRSSRSGAQPSPGVPEESATAGGESAGQQVPGTRVPFQFTKPPPVPASLLALKDPLLRQHAKEAWAAATKLYGVLMIWQTFFLAVQLGLRMDDSLRQWVAALFPTLSSIQLVLD